MGTVGGYSILPRLSDGRGPVIKTLWPIPSPAAPPPFTSRSLTLRRGVPRSVWVERVRGSAERGGGGWVLTRSRRRGMK